MEAKNLYVLTGTEAFMPGDLDNVTIQNGCIVLDVAAGRHVLYGCYTSAPVSMPNFDRLVMSWNADTPEGTVVEAQARVLVDGNWSHWSTFGRWSPFLTARANAKRPPRGPVSVENNILALDSKQAVQAQMRIYLYTDDEKLTPSVNLLALSVRPCGFSVRVPSQRPIHRSLRIPAYSQLLRDPLFRGAVSLPVCLAGLMNRWGEDVLPEELAHAMYDWADNTCSNPTFGTAAAGCWGYESYAAWCDLPHLHEELREGYAVAVRLSYPGRAIEPPALADLHEQGSHYVTVTGFITEDGRDYVLVNEPLAPDDGCVPRKWDIDYFLDAWDGLTLLLHRRAQGRGWFKPARVAVSLKPCAPGSRIYHLFVKGEQVPLTADFCGTVGVPRGSLAIVKNGQKVFATTAHKRFRFVDPRQGGLEMPPPSQPPVRYGVYAIDATGRMLVGEVYL